MFCFRLHSLSSLLVRVGHLLAGSRLSVFDPFRSLEAGIANDCFVVETDTCTLYLSLSSEVG
jgi:hypothetical protein